MNRILSTVCAVVLLAGLSGCHCNRGPCADGCFDCQEGILGNIGSSLSESDTCQDCDDGNGHHRRHARRAGRPYAAGPPSAAVTYPYYTTRGPRDFLAKDPRGIGP